MVEPIQSQRSFQAIGVSSTERLQLQSDAEHVASFIRLPFRNMTWRGASGAWQGAGVGSSVDFQDHRQYLPGDDPRYINWQAYARTGNYTMKLYREEVSPQLDLVLDVSSSMFVNTQKSHRVVELFHFLVSSAQRAGASLACFQVRPEGVRSIELEAIQTGQWDLYDGVDDADASHGEVPAYSTVPWRNHALKIIVSDLLYEGAPEVILSEIASTSARALLFCPWCDEEQDPDWLGNVELRNCETQAKRELRMTDRELHIYQQRYRQHFLLWQEACAKRGFGFARVDASTKLQDALLKEPLSGGLVELWN